MNTITSLFKTQEEKNKTNNKSKVEDSNEPNTTKSRFSNIISFNNNEINLLGFSIAIDDLIIIVLIILLFFQNTKDYTLLIILGLLLFNVSFNNLNFF